MIAKKKTAKKSPSPRRAYNSPLRKQQATETRQRIIQAGVEVIHELPNWNWKRLTFRAVGERANISERTVYRYFSTERKLKDAIMQALVNNSGIDLTSLQLNKFSAATAAVFEFLNGITHTTEDEQEPTFTAIDEHRRQALLNAVTIATPNWLSEEQENIAALLDILWNIPPYERLTKLWGLDNERATTVVCWLIHLIEDAVKQGHRPG